MRHLVFTSPLVAVVVALAGCGGSTDDASSTVPFGDDGGVNAEADAGAEGAAGGDGAAPDATDAPAVPYPAPHPSMPEMTNHGGKVLSAPVLVTVTFAGDPLEQTIQTFDDAIGGLSWWSTTMGEYGIAPATSGGHVVVADPAPSTISDGEIQKWILAGIADATLPAPTDQTIYLLYYPETTTITIPGGQGVSCQSFGGYHSWLYLSGDGGKQPIQYAVLPRCGSLDSLTVAASHEITEASTDPNPALLAGLPNTTGGWVLDGPTAWSSPQAGGENADLCEFFGSVSEGGYALTRAWSNAAAKLGENPCVPVPPDPAGLPYFNAAIVDEILTASPGGDVSTELRCYSFGPLPGPMDLATQSFSQTLTFEFSQPSCVNGDVVTMTIHVDDTAQPRDYRYFLTPSVGGGTAHAWRGQVTVE